MSRGWISLHRSILDNWVWQEDRTAKAFVTMLLTVNHTKKRVPVRGKLLDCDVGQSVLSKDSWAKKFGNSWNRKKVERFFLRLENDHMIVQENVHHTTRVTICNYKEYQRVVDNVHPQERPDKVPPNVHHASTTRPQLNNDNNEIKKNNGEKSPVFDSALRFAEWYSMYPKKVAKGQAQKAFRANCKDEKKFKIIMDGLKAQLPSLEAKEKRYRPNPATWLNGQCWEDELDTPAGGGDMFDGMHIQ